MTDAQALTKEAYEDPVVKAFGEANRKSPSFRKDFAESLRGKRLLDAGCGPGRGRPLLCFTRLRGHGIRLLGSDDRGGAGSVYWFEPAALPGAGLAGRRRGVPEASFDGAWVCASLLHVPEPEVPDVLAGLRRVLTAGGRVMITIKEGPQGAALVTEHKHGRVLQREFVFWGRASFEAALERAGFHVVGFKTNTGGTTGGQPTQWLRFTAEAEGQS